jgi:hypothetical protein
MTSGALALNWLATSYNLHFIARVRTCDDKINGETEEDKRVLRRRIGEKKGQSVHKTKERESQRT